MDVKDIKKLLESMAEADASELSLETGDYKLSVKRGAASAPQVTFVDAPAPQVVQQAQPQVQVPQAQAPQAQAAAPAPQAAPPAQAEETAPPANSNLKDVTAPIVGTFYSSSAPDAPAYVKVGDHVEKGAILCIIEAMKLMNEIEAETAGTVSEILVANEEPVEYGQVLFRIDPS